MNGPGARRALRWALTGLLAAAAGLGLLLAASLLARGEVISRVREYDSNSAIAGLELAPGCLRLQRLELPGRGAYLRDVTVLLEGPAMRPRAGLVSVGGGTVDLRRVLGDGGGEGGGGGEGLPPIVFHAVLLHDGADSALCSGSLAGGGSGALASLRGSWGRALVRLRRRPACDSLLLWASGLSRIPFSRDGMPRQLQGRSYDARLAGARVGDELRLAGRITGIDGDAVDVPLSLQGGPGGLSARLMLRMDSFEEWLEERTMAAGVAYAGMTPGGSVLVTLDRDSTLSFACSMSVTPLRLFDPELCGDTLVMNVGLICQGTYSPETGLLSVESGSLSVEDAQIPFDLEFRPSPGPRLRVSVWSDSLHRFWAGFEASVLEAAWPSGSDSFSTGPYRTAVTSPRMWTQAAFAWSGAPSASERFGTAAPSAGWRTAGTTSAPSPWTPPPIPAF